MNEESPEIYAKIHAIYYFNDKLESSQLPYDYNNLKETIKKLYNLNDPCAGFDYINNESKNQIKAKIKKI